MYINTHTHSQVNVSLRSACFSKFSIWIDFLWKQVIRDTLKWAKWWWLVQLEGDMFSKVVPSFQQRLSENFFFLNSTSYYGRKPQKLVWLLGWKCFTPQVEGCHFKMSHLYFLYVEYNTNTWSKIVKNTHYGGGEGGSETFTCQLQ